MRFRIHDILKIGVAFCLLSVFIGCAPDPNTILERSLESCLLVNNGYYECVKEIRLMSQEEISHINQKSYFEKLDGDSLFSFRFNNHVQSGDIGSTMNLLYTGSDVVSYDDKYAISMSRDRVQDIKNAYIKNMFYSSYWPIVCADGYPMPNKDYGLSGDLKAAFLGMVVLDGVDCYHISVDAHPEYDRSVLRTMLTKLKYEFWINKTDYIPVQFSITRHLTVNGKTVSEFEQMRLTKYEFNSLADTTILTLSAVPEDITIETAPPFQEEEVCLKVGDKAPKWVLMSSDGHNISLPDGREEFTILDFFYISCPPCIENIPQLNLLQKLYSKQNVSVVGVSSGEKHTMAIYGYMERNAVSYPVVFDLDGAVAKEYHITNFPTTFIVDANGNIVYSHIGKLCSENMKEIDQIINQNIPGR